MNHPAPVFSYFVSYSYTWKNTRTFAPTQQKFGNWVIDMSRPIDDFGQLIDVADMVRTYLNKEHRDDGWIAADVIVLSYVLLKFGMSRQRTIGSARDRTPSRRARK